MTVPHISYSGQPLAELVDVFATGKPVPGGGPAAAIAAALGTSLVRMAANLANDRRAAAGEEGERALTIARLGSAQGHMLALADRDSVAYASVLAAYRLPRGTELERETRAAAIQSAMEAATDTPLQIMDACGHVLREAVPIAEQVPAAAKIDLAIGIELLDASVRGCGMCVRANAAHLRSADVGERVALAAAEIQAAAAGNLGRIRAALATS